MPGICSLRGRQEREGDKESEGQKEGLKQRRRRGEGRRRRREEEEEKEDKEEGEKEERNTAYPAKTGPNDPFLPVRPTLHSFQHFPIVHLVMNLPTVHS